LTKPICSKVAELTFGASVDQSLTKRKQFVDVEASPNMGK